MKPQCFPLEISDLTWDWTCFNRLNLQNLSHGCILPGSKQVQSCARLVWETIPLRFKCFYLRLDEWWLDSLDRFFIQPLEKLTRGVNSDSVHAEVWHVVVWGIYSPLPVCCIFTGRGSLARGPCKSLLRLDVWVSSVLKAQRFLRETHLGGSSALQFLFSLVPDTVLGCSRVRCAMSHWALLMLCGGSAFRLASGHVVCIWPPDPFRGKHWVKCRSKELIAESLCGCIVTTGTLNDMRLLLETPIHTNIYRLEITDYKTQKVS